MNISFFVWYKALHFLKIKKEIVISWFNSLSQIMKGNMLKSKVSQYNFFFLPENFSFRIFSVFLFQKKSKSERDLFFRGF